MPLPVEAILDGEVVSPDPEGWQDFRGLLAGRGTSIMPHFGRVDDYCKAL